MSRSLSRHRYNSTTAHSLGALALGALAVGALAIGFLAINWLVVRRARFDRLDIADLRIGRLIVRRTVEESEPDWGF